MANNTDWFIIGGGFFILIVLGFLIPQLQEEFGFGQTDYDVEGSLEGIRQEGSDINVADVVTLSPLRSIIVVLFWHYSFLPAWVSLIHHTLQFILWGMLIAKFIRGS